MALARSDTLMLNASRSCYPMSSSYQTSLRLTLNKSHTILTRYFSDLQTYAPRRFADEFATLLARRLGANSRTFSSVHLIAPKLVRLRLEFRSGTSTF